MRHLFIRLGLGLGIVAVLAFPYDALASCTLQTIVLPDGRMLTCTVCCFPNGSCNTNCH